MQRRDMGGSKIAHVDEIAFAGAVRRRVIQSENLQGRAAPDCGIDCQWNEMRLRIVPLGECSVRVGAGGIEVAKDCVTKLVRGSDIEQDLLAGQLRSAV